MTLRDLKRKAKAHYERLGHQLSIFQRPYINVLQGKLSETQAYAECKRCGKYVNIDLIKESMWITNSSAGVRCGS